MEVVTAPPRASRAPRTSSSDATRSPRTTTPIVRDSRSRVMRACVPHPVCDARPRSWQKNARMHQRASHATDTQCTTRGVPALTNSTRATQSPSGGAPHTHTQSETYTYTHTHSPKHTHTHSHTHTTTAHRHTHTHARTHTHTHIHTHTHTCTHAYTHNHRTRHTPAAPTGAFGYACYHIRKCISRAHLEFRQARLRLAH